MDSAAPRITSELAWAAASFAIDAQTAEVTSALDKAGIRSILLKGPAIAEWLYKGRAVRAYGDTDLLVSPRDWDATLSILCDLGFREGLDSGDHPRMASIHSYPMIRGTDNVDLHSTLWGIRANSETVWRAFSERTDRMRVGGRMVEILAPGARALHIALHAAQHGPDARKPMADLRNALQLVPEEVWHEAARYAEQVDASDVLATALKHTPEGALVAEKIGVSDKRSIDALIRLSQVPLAEGFQELATTPGIRRKISLLKRELAPSVEFMRWWSPLARKGRLGLILAYLWRPLWFLWRAGPAFAAWRRARRAAASTS